MLVETETYYGLEDCKGELYVLYKSMEECIAVVNSGKNKIYGIRVVKLAVIESVLAVVPNNIEAISIE